MYLTRKNTILFVVGILLAMLIVAPIVFFTLRSGKADPKENNKINDKAGILENQVPVGVPKVVKTQEEIWTEYDKNINTLLTLVNTSEESPEVILSKVEAGFFDIFVPTDKKDLHFQTFLQIQQTKLDGNIDSKEKLREYMVPLLTALLNRD